MNKINFQNLPTQTTPLNATNMNQMQENMDDVDVLRQGKTPIPENADLNNYTTDGTYRADSAAIAATLTNCPVSSTAFKMKVEHLHSTANDRIRQTIYQHIQTSNTYVRTCQSGTWGEWQMVDTTTIVSNANGTAIKYSDGTMICTKRVEASSVTFSASGNIYVSTAIALGTYAVEFISAPILQVTCKGSSMGWISQVASVGKNTIGNVTIAKATSTSASYNIDITAIGTWR